MAEIGANTSNSSGFIQVVNQQDIETALKLGGVPAPSREFT